MENRKCVLNGKNKRKQFNNLTNNIGLIEKVCQSMYLTKYLLIQFSSEESSYITRFFLGGCLPNSARFSVTLEQLLKIYVFLLLRGLMFSSKPNEKFLLRDMFFQTDCFSIKLTEELDEGC